MSNDKEWKDRLMKSYKIPQQKTQTDKKMLTETQRKQILKKD